MSVLKTMPFVLKIRSFYLKKKSIETKVTRTVNLEIKQSFFRLNMYFREMVGNNIEAEYLQFL